MSARRLRLVVDIRHVARGVDEDCRKHNPSPKQYKTRQRSRRGRGQCLPYLYVRRI